MKKVCHNCKKSFTPAHNRKEGKYCTISCYQNNRSNKSKFNWSQFAWDGACLMTPVLILAFAIYCVTEKEDFISAKQNIKKELLDNPLNCCDDVFSFDEEDEKYLAAILKRR